MRRNAIRDSEAPEKKDAHPVGLRRDLNLVQGSTEGEKTVDFYYSVGIKRKGKWLVIHTVSLQAYVRVVSRSFYVCCLEGGAVFYE